MENNTKPSSSSSSSSSKLRSKILKIIPKAAAAMAVTFQNPPFSPGRDHHKVRSSENAASSATTTRLKPHGNNYKGFSGPMMIPAEARRKPKDGGGIETQEPTSPKVSCIGQIKHKKKQIKKHNAKSMSLPIATNDTTPATPKDTTTEEKNKKKKKFQRKFFQTGKPKTGVRKSSASSTSLVGGEGKNHSNDDDGVSDNAPPIGYMRRFASGRETFANFDWKAQVAPEETNHRDCYSEDDRADESDAEEEEEGEEEEEEEEEVIIPFSAPIGGRGGGNNNGGFVSGGSVANLQPRKEINLWKRRTMAPPRPLQLNPVLTAK